MCDCDDIRTRLTIREERLAEKQGRHPEAMGMFVVAIAGVLKALEVCLDMCWKSSLGQQDNNMTWDVFGL